MYSRASGHLTAILKPDGQSLGFVAKARSRRRKRRFNLRKVRIATDIGVGALDPQDVAVGLLTPVAADKIRIITLSAAWSWADLSEATMDSLEFGVCHSDYSAAEVEESLEAAGSFDLGDKVAQEQANRLVRSIGMISNEGAAQGGGRFNEGRQTKTKLNWLLSAGDSLNVWVRNGSGVVYATGSTIVTIGNLWVKD